jgi:hypothetical protein
LAEEFTITQGIPDATDFKRSSKIASADARHYQHRQTQLHQLRQMTMNRAVAA